MIMEAGHGQLLPLTVGVVEFDLDFTGIFPAMGAITVLIIHFLRTVYTQPKADTSVPSGWLPCIG